MTASVAVRCSVDPFGHSRPKLAGWSGSPRTPVICGPEDSTMTPQPIPQYGQVERVRVGLGGGIFSGHSGGGPMSDVLSVTRSLFQATDDGGLCAASSANFGLKRWLGVVVAGWWWPTPLTRYDSGHSVMDSVREATAADQASRG